MILLLSLCWAQSTAGEWFAAGIAHHSGGRYDEALHSFREASRLNYQPAFAPAFRSARALSMKGDLSAALDHLQKAADSGFSHLPVLLNDADLQPVRREARFGAIAGQIDRNGKPCLTDTKYREFDF
jgi:tetratricopeptide (TPR) repeat protein